MADLAQLGLDVQKVLVSTPQPRGGNCAESDRDFDWAYPIHFNSRSTADEPLERTERLPSAEEHLGWRLSTTEERVEETERLSTTEERLEWRLSTADERLEESECLSTAKERVD